MRPRFRPLACGDAVAPAQRGFSYVEVLLSVVLLAVLLVPATDALRSGITGGNTSTAANQHLLLSAKMEDVLSRPFADLYRETYLPGGNTSGSASAAYSDAGGTSDRRVVVLYRYDATAKALSAGDTGLLYVNVYFESGGAVPLDTLVGRWW